MFRYNPKTHLFESATESLTRAEFEARNRAAHATRLNALPQPTRAERRLAVQLHADEARIQKLSNGRSGIVRATKGGH